MNSRDYWAKREEENLKHYLKDEEAYEKEVQKIYTRTLANVQKEINAFYGNYAKKENISLAEAKKRVSALDIKAYEAKAEQYVKDRTFSKQANEEMRLYNATMKINRLEMLKANIGLELIAGHDDLEKFMEGILKGRTEEELKRQAGILGKTITNNAQMVHSIVNASFHNAKFSDRIWMYQSLLRSDLEIQLSRGMIQGKNPRELARGIKERFDVRTSDAERLMRTELARVQTEAQKQSFIRNGFTQYMFIVNGGCCDICEEIKGKIYDVKDMQPGENAPPMHPHCRCSIAAYEDSKEYEAWLDFLYKGGTTAEWNKSGKEKWLKSLEKSGQGSTIKYKLEDSTDKWAKEAKAELLSYESNIASRKKETAVVYDNNGKVLFRKYGTEEDVSFNPIEFLKLKGKVVTHNHPSGGSLSVADIYLLKTSKASEIRVATEKCSYYMRLPETWDSRINSKKEIKAEREKIQKQLRSKYQQLYLDGKITKAERFQMFSDETNKIFAERFGIEYGKENY